MTPKPPPQSPRVKCDECGRYTFHEPWCSQISTKQTPPAGELPGIDIRWFVGWARLVLYGAEQNWREVHERLDGEPVTYREYPVVAHRIDELREAVARYDARRVAEEAGQHSARSVAAEMRDAAAALIDPVILGQCDFFWEWVKRIEAEREEGFSRYIECAKERNAALDRTLQLNIALDEARTTESKLRERIAELEQSCRIQSASLKDIARNTGRPITPAQGGEAPGGGEVTLVECGACHEHIRTDQAHLCPAVVAKMRRPKSPPPTAAPERDAGEKCGAPCDGKGRWWSPISLSWIDCRPCNGTGRRPPESHPAAPTPEPARVFGEPGDWNDEAVFNAQCEAIDKHHREVEAMKASLEAARALAVRIDSGLSYSLHIGKLSDPDGLRKLLKEFEAALGPSASPTTGKDGR